MGNMRNTNNTLHEKPEERQLGRPWYRWRIKLRFIFK
jgi:hypothetical protein